MKAMTTHERMSRMYQHREADRVPITDGPWESTILRWRREGLPQGVDWQDYLEVDRFASIGGLDTSPRFPRQVIEESDTYIIERDSWGITKKNFKPVNSTPMNIDHAIKDPGTWRRAKERMLPSRDRVDWDHLARHYPGWRSEGAWIIAGPWFGYDIVNARMVGTETLLLAMADDPEWVVDMLSHLCDMALALLDMVWEAGYDFDELQWPDDMGYKNGLLFSKKMWREMVRPYQARAIDWAHAHGIVAHIHSCGNISALVPDLVDLGLDGLNPLEIKAGMEPLALKSSYGGRLLLKGGFDIRNWSDWPLAEADIRAKLPLMMNSGGYIFSSDHSIAESVSLENYRRIVQLAKEIGRY
jgi:uroporphyrinogen decarboxylase